MSGRWRSRHWRGEDGQNHPQQHQQRSQEFRDRSRERRPHHHDTQHDNPNNYRWGHQGDDDYGGSGAIDRGGGDDGGPLGSSYHRPHHNHEQQHQHHHHDDERYDNNKPPPRWGDHPSYDNNNNDTTTANNNRFGGEQWRRGQSLSNHPPPSFRNASRERHHQRAKSSGRDGGRDGKRPNKSEARRSSSSRAVSVGRPSSRATFPAAPARGAWGNTTNTNNGGSALKNDGERERSATAPPSVTNNNKNAWAKPADSAVVAANTAAGVAIKKEEQNTVNPWTKNQQQQSSSSNSSSLQKAASGKTIHPVVSIMKREDNAGKKNTTNNNPWGVTSSAPPKGNTKQVVVDVNKKSSSAAFPPMTANDDASNNKKASAAAAPAETPSSSSLPSTSSWGKNRPTTTTVAAPSSSASASAQAKATNNKNASKDSNKKAKKKVDEFPSLSTSTNARSQTKKLPSLVAKTAVTPTSNEKQSKNNNNNNKGPSGKKAAATTNLASFLTTTKGAKKKPSQGGVRATTVTSCLPKNVNKNSRSVVKAGVHTTVGGVKRSAPSSTTNNNLTATGEDSMGSRGGGFANFPNTKGGGSATIIGGTGGDNNNKGGGVVKKGRQRVVGAPRKKKLTTLKKKVLKERLRVWKERNGIVDDDDEKGGVGGDVDGENYSSKRLKTDGSSATSTTTSTTALGGVGNNKKTTITATTTTTTTTTSLLVENFIQPKEDDLTDEDEYDEILSNLISLAGRVGKVLSVFIPRPSTTSLGEDGGSIQKESKHVGLAFVRFATINDVSAAKEILDGMVVSGQKIRTFILESESLVPFNDNWKESNSTAGAGAGVAVAPSAENDTQWQAAVLKAVEERQSKSFMDVSNDDALTINSSASAQKQPPLEATTSTATIIFHNILCEDDYNDNDALEESLEDLRGLAQQYGQVNEYRASTSGLDRGNVYITFGDGNAAEKAVGQLDGIVVGGSKIVVSREGSGAKNLQQQQQPSMTGKVVLNNVLNEDDFDDEDCLNESVEDIRNLAQQYGTVVSVTPEVSGEQKGQVVVVYSDGHHVANEAAAKLDGMVLGGLTISASVVVSAQEDSNSNPPNSSNNEEHKKEQQHSPPPPPPMYSGEKIIPERFAACKRVPKIPNPGTPRSYATKIPNDTALPLLITMLGELMRLQERSKDDKNARARRRLVMGLREVARGIRSNKVKMVIMANNLDEYGAIDSKLQEILDMAREKDLPVLFEMNKRKLGKALGKSIKVSVVGIQNADGAHEPFKKLKKMMGMA